MSISTAEHVELVTSLFVLDEYVHDELKKLSTGKREVFAARILALMATSDLAKAKGLMPPG